MKDLAEWYWSWGWAVAAVVNGIVWGYIIDEQPASALVSMGSYILICAFMLYVR